MNESNVIRYDAGPGGMEKCPDGDFVTHADYRALEEKYLELWDVQAWTTNQLDEAREELAALRGKVWSIEKKDVDTCNREYANGWNACRLALEVLK